MWKRLMTAATLLLMAGCSQITVLDPKSATGKDQAYLIWFSLAIMLLVLLVVFVLFTIFVWRYRATEARKDELPTDVKGHLKLELLWTIIPVILLLILAIPTVKITLEQSPETSAGKQEEGVHINVFAEQFAWTFEYSNGKEKKGELVLPEGEPIHLHLKSKDVIHSFWVPELAGKVDVMPHETLTYVIEDPEAGTYAGKCAEYCGTQHANMTFEVEVVPMDEYKQYVQEDDD